MVGQKSKMRSERKKKKLAAFLQIAKLNEVDEEEKIKMKRLKEESCDPSPKRLKEELPLDSMETENKEQNTDLVNEPKADQCSNPMTPDLSNADLSSSNIEEMRKVYRERARKRQKLPRFRLKENGEMASFDTPEARRIPLFMVDVQHLIMCSLIGHHAPFSAPRWFQLQKFNKLSQTVVLVVDDVSLEDLHLATSFLHLPSNTPEEESTKSKPKILFPWRLELVGPSTYGSNLIQEMATIPLSNTQYDRLIKKFGTLEKAVEGKRVYRVFRAMFPIRVEAAEEEMKIKEEPKDNNESEEKEMEERANNKDKFLRTQLLLSASQMAEMGYPLPIAKSSNADSVKQPVVFPITDDKHADSLGSLIHSPEFKKNFAEVPNIEIKCEVIDDDDTEKSAMEKDDMDKEKIYVLSRPWYKEVGPNSPLLAVDCEMCMTGKQRFELTRISIVDEDLKVVYESYVKPYRKITNFLTRYSGITPNHLKNVKTRLRDVQRAIRKLLPPDAILVGQSLNFDLHAMKMMHPYVIDTSVVYNLSGHRSKKTKLATLSRLFLSEEIQCWGSKGHDSIEDASAAMKLILLKLSKSLDYGDAAAGWQLVKKEKVKGKMEPRHARLAKDLGTGAHSSYGTSIFAHVKRGKHTAVIVGLKDVIAEYENYAECHSKQGNKLFDETPTEESTAKLIPVEQAKEILSRACEVMLDHQLCIIHQTRDYVGEKLEKLHKWCKKIVKCAAPDTLIIVILGGAESANGSCMIHLKSSVDSLT